MTQNSADDDVVGQKFHEKNKTEFKGRRGGGEEEEGEDVWRRKREDKKRKTKRTFVIGRILLFRCLLTILQ